MYEQQITGTQFVPVRTNHLLHLALFCLSLGLWAPVWFIVTLYNHNRTKLVTTHAALVGGYAPGIACRVLPDPLHHQNGHSWCMSHGMWHADAPLQLTP